jgi:hypothetical protein
MDTVDRPIDDRRSGFAARASLTFSSARAGFANGPTATGSAQKLPTIAGTNPWIITACDVACAVALDHIEASVSLVCIERSADIRRETIAAIATSARDADPIRAARTLCCILSRLIEGAVVANDYDDASYIARRDDPGICPGDGWQILSRSGRRGPVGESGPRGRKGERGARGEATPTIINWTIDRVHYRAIPTLSDGKPGAPLDLRPLFEAYHVETSSA